MKKDHLPGVTLQCSPHSERKPILSMKACSAFLLILLVQLFSLTAIAQSKVISGTVKNDKGEPIQAASVVVKGTTKGTTTDVQGKYSIEVPGAKAVLVFSSVSFASKELSVSGNSIINVTMEPEETKNLNEVVVIGYGTTKKATLTGSVSAIKGKDLLESPATNVSNSLAGRLPGLVAITGSGEPGYDGSTLRIRGANTLNDNSVLIIVDGIPGRSLERIDPNSIESITVLKDASAAIYGAQAANGVILVTTKRGRIGKPEITVNANFGYNQPTRLPKMANAATFATMLNEIASYAGSAPKYTAQEIQKYKDGSDPWSYPNTDWFKETLKPRSAQNAYNVSVSGGTDALRYFVSLGSKTQEGNYYHSATHYNQYDFRSNLDGRISKDISIGVDVAGRMEDRNYPTRGAGAIFRMLMRGKPNYPAYWPNGTPGPDIEYGDNPVVISTDATGYDKDKYYALNSNLKLNINIPWVKGLSISGNAAIDKGFDFRKTWYTPWYLYTWDGSTKGPDGQPLLVKGKRGFDDARLNEYSRDELNSTLYGLINYQTKIGEDHDIKVLVGAQKSTGNGDYFSAFRRYYTSTAIDQLFAGGNAEINNGGSGYVNARMSYFGRVNYGYQNKYLAEFVWRYDGSYIFPENKRFGFFPGISLGWRASEEDFWKKNLSFINDFKLRASWGQTGNDRIQEFQYLGTYAYGNVIGSPFLPFVVNGSVEIPGLYETRIPNPNATWEIANQANVGFDASFLNNKLSVVADYFNYKRSQILIQRNASVPQSAGLTLPPENIGKVANKGFDFMVTYRDKAGLFNYSVSVNGGYQKNKILFWDEPPGAPVYQQSTGHPMNSGLYYESLGVFADQNAVDKYPHWTDARPGDLIFKDENGDGKIDGNDRVRIDKSNLPTFTWGTTVNLEYKGFDLSLLIQGASGAVNYISTESGEIGNFLQSFANDRWTVDNINAKGPRTYNRGNEYWVNQGNTYWLHKTDYVRLKTFQVGYSLPEKISKRFGIQKFRLYVSGYNVFTISPDYKDFDPELSAGSGQSYPLERVISAGFTLTF
jgi:TonB-dependent starch-binding outer membrane protein SusC